MLQSLIGQGTTRAGAAGKWGRRAR